MTKKYHKEQNIKNFHNDTNFSSIMKQVKNVNNIKTEIEPLFKFYILGNILSYQLN